MLIRSTDTLEQFCHDNPAYRRWYVARITGSDTPAGKTSEHPDERKSYIDLYYAPISEEHHVAAIQQLEQYEASNFRELESDNMNWWSDEDFDSPVHLPLKDFRSFLDEHDSSREEGTLVEGMVFIEVHRDGGFRFVHYTSQAREASKEIVRELLKGGLEL
jgi:hypothetical protein